MRRLTLPTLCLIAALLSAGCEYGVPLAAKQGLPLDYSLFGHWEHVGAKGEKWTVTFWRLADGDYSVRFLTGKEEMFLRGYPINVAGASYVQLVQTDENYAPKEGHYHVISYEAAGDELTINLLSKLGPGQKSSADLMRDFLKHKDAASPFTPLQKFRRVKTVEQMNLEVQLRQASGKGDLVAVQGLLAKGVDVNAKDLVGATALMLASAGKHLPVVRALLARGADPAARDNEGFTALSAACEGGSLPVVQALLLKGAQVNTANKNGFTALMSASAEGHLPVVRALLAKGAQVNARSGAGLTALRVASANGHAVVVQALLAGGADVNAKDPEGITALMRAAAKGHLPVVQALLAGGADVNATDEEFDDTALILAAGEGHLAVVQALVAKGANVHAENLLGFTALEAATENRHAAVAQFLAEEQKKPCPAQLSSEHLFRLNDRVQTGLVVRRGDRLDFQAGGSVSFGPMAGSGGPEGINGFRGYNLLRDADVQHGALIARIKRQNENDGWYYIGRGRQIVSDVDGTLELDVNDRDASNNSGQFEVRVKLCKAR